MKELDEEKMSISAWCYCPQCEGGGDLFVKDSNAYCNEKPYDYFCKKCKQTFKIEVVT